MQGQAWQEAAPHLAQALQHHSGITSLRLDLPCIDAASAQLLAPAIASLKSLQSLHMHSGVDASTSVTLQQMLQALPQLQHLSLSLRLVSDSLKRQRHGRIACSSELCLAAILSPATRLTSLQLYAHGDSGQFVTLHPVEPPHLSQLDMLFDAPIDSDTIDIRTTNSQSVASSHLLSKLSAPLTSLDLHPRRCWENILRPEDTAHALRLCSSLAQFTHLRRLCIRIPADKGFKQQVIRETGTVAAPPALAELRRLEHLNFAAELNFCAAALPLLVRATGLSHLELDCCCSLLQSYSPADTAHFVSGLSILPLLSLNLDLQIDKDMPGISSLLEHGLTRLTALRMLRWECLQTPADIAAIARMTDLQKLHLLIAPMGTPLHASFVRVLQTYAARSHQPRTHEWIHSHGLLYSRAGG